MVENCFSVAVFCVCSAIFAVLLRQHCHEQSLMIALAACVAVVGGFMLFLAPLVSEVQDIFSQAGISDSYISLIFKAAAVCFITQITCEICRDSGENALALNVEAAGRVTLAVMALPLFEKIAEIAAELIN